MGLYGALVVTPAAASPWTTDRSAVVVISEIDPALNASADPADVRHAQLRPEVHAAQRRDVPDGDVARRRRNRGARRRCPPALRQRWHQLPLDERARRQPAHRCRRRPHARRSRTRSWPRRSARARPRTRSSTCRPTRSPARSSPCSTATSNSATAIAARRLRRRYCQPCRRRRMAARWRSSKSVARWTTQVPWRRTSREPPPA